MRPELCVAGRDESHSSINFSVARRNMVRREALCVPTVVELLANGMRVRAQC